MTMMVRGVRGAITVEANEEDAILSATVELLRALIAANDIEEDQVASVIFTTTPDLDACYPAAAARQLGWTRVALLGVQEIDAPSGVPRAVRILVHWNTDKSLDAINHVYMRDAVRLRPDLQPTNRVILNGKEQNDEQREDR